MPTFHHMVALGSSFAAGPGIPPVVNAAAGRSGANYPHLLAETLGAELTDATVSGATTATILRESQRTLRRRFAPQIRSVTPYTDLVTVTAGGNDLGYLGSLMTAAGLNRLSELPVIGAAFRPLLARKSLEPPTPEAIGGAAAGLARIVQEARSISPGATVLLIDYLPILDAGTTPAGLSAEQVTHFRSVAEALSQAFGAAAHRSDALLLPASAYQAGHGVGSPGPWVSGFGPRASSFHPTAAGMREVARLAAQVLRI